MSVWTFNFMPDFYSPAPFLSRNLNIPRKSQLSRRGIQFA